MSRRGQEAWVSVPARPVIEVVLDEQGRGTVDGRPVPIDDPEDPQASLLAEAVRQAEKLSRPVRVRALDPDGVWHLVAHPDGTVTEQDDVPAGEELPDGPGAAYGDPDDTGPWHLRVHPNGEIIPLADDDLLDLENPPDAPPLVPRPAPSPSRSAAAAAAAAAFWTAAPPEQPDALVPEPDDLVPEPDDLVPEPDALVPEPEPEPEFVDEPEPEFEVVDEPAALEELEAFEPGEAPSDEVWIDPAEIEPDPVAEPLLEDRLDDEDQEEEEAEPVVPDAWLSAPTLLGPPMSVAPTPSPATAPATSPAAGQGRTLPPDVRARADAILGDLRSADLSGPAPTRPASRWVRPAAMVGAGVLMAGVIGFTLVGGDDTPSPTVATASDAASASAPASAGVRTSRSAAAAEAPPTAPVPSVLASPPASLSVAPPPGFARAPRWAMPISPAAMSLVSADGRVLTLTGDNQVALLDPATGRVRWHVPAPSGATGPHLVRIDGRDVAAVMTADRLTYWPLPAARSTGTTPAAAPTSVDLPAGTAVSWSGPSPLLVLGDGTAAVVRDGAVQRVTLPTGMKPLAADAADVLAYGARSWIRQGAGQGPGTPQPFTPPEGATGTAPIRVENVGGSFLATMWQGAAGPVVAAVDAHSGAVVVHTVFPKDVDFTRAPTVREVGSERTVVGTALFEPAQANLSILASTFTPVALTPGHVFADDVSGVVADLQINGKQLKVVPFKGKNPIVPVGIVAGTSPIAVVAAPFGTGWLLCGLPPG